KDWAECPRRYIWEVSLIRSPCVRSSRFGTPERQHGDKSDYTEVICGQLRQGRSLRYPSAAEIASPSLLTSGSAGTPVNGNNRCERGLECGRVRVRRTAGGPVRRPILRTAADAAEAVEAPAAADAGGRRKRTLR